MPEVDKRGTDPSLYDASNPADVEAWQLAVQIAAAAEILRQAQEAKRKEERELRQSQKRRQLRDQFMSDYGIYPSEAVLDDLVRRDSDSIDYSGW